MRLCVTLGWPCCLVAWLLVFYEVESVVITGPVLFALGMFTILAAAITRRPIVLALGVGHCFVCLLFVALVNLLRWDPGEAKTPFKLMGTAYLVVSAAPTVLIHLALSRTGVVVDPDRRTH